MASSRHSAAPLNRWKSRFWMFTKPMFWASSAVLLLSALLIADYSRVSVSPEELEATRATQLPEDGRTQATVDEIPLADDPELQDLREWLVQDAVSSDTAEDDTAENPDLEAIATELGNDGRSDENDVIAPNTATAKNGLGLLNGQEGEDPSDEDIADDEATSPQRRDRLNSTRASLFDEYVTRADDVLGRMGLTLPNAPPSEGLLTLPASQMVLPPSTSSSVGLLDGTNQLSALFDAIQSLSPETSTSLTESVANRLDTGAESLSGRSLDPLTQGLQSTLQSSTDQFYLDSPLPAVQTAPLPGTTGYTLPQSLAQPSGFSSTAPGSSLGSAIISVPNSSAIAGPITSEVNPLTGLSSNSSVAPIQPAVQPTVSLPQQATPTLPSPIFPATVQPEEHVPYTGGGRDGRINTFSNP